MHALESQGRLPFSFLVTRADSHTLVPLRSLGRMTVRPWSLLGTRAGCHALVLFSS